MRPIAFASSGGQVGTAEGEEARRCPEPAIRQRTEDVLPHMRALVRVKERELAVHLPERRACRSRHYSSLSCRRMAGASGATGHRRNSADSSQPPRAIECSRATAHTSAGSITSATSVTPTTPTRSSSAVAVSSPGGGVSFPSARWPKSNNGRGRLSCAAPGRHRRCRCCRFDAWPRSRNDGRTPSRERVRLVLAAARRRSLGGSRVCSVRTRCVRSTTRTSSNCGGIRPTEGGSGRVG